MELKEGMYVRFNYHRVTVPIQIAKIKEKYYDEMEKYYYYLTDNGLIISEENIIKSSENIIDLIEAGDYVNGDKVTEEMIKMRDKQGVFGLPDKHRVFIDEIKVKNIVTKEQFAFVKYEVE